MTNTIWIYNKPLGIYELTVPHIGTFHLRPNINDGREGSRADISYSPQGSSYSLEGHFRSTGREPLMMAGEYQSNPFIHNHTVLKASPGLPYDVRISLIRAIERARTIAQDIPIEIPYE